METLDCMSPRTCPSCWHFRAGHCALTGAVNTALLPASGSALLRSPHGDAAGAPTGPLTGLLSLDTAHA